jgi:hypothetical protein
MFLHSFMAPGVSKAKVWWNGVQAAPEWVVILIRPEKLRANSMLVYWRESSKGNRKNRVSRYG